mgnify:CR=1 FL=1
MRNLYILLVLVPALLFAGNLQPVTVLPEEPQQVNGSEAVPVTTRQATAPGARTYTVGRVDTIGGTTYDWQFNGPVYRMLVNSPHYGLHAGWMFSATETPWADRNMRYNYFDYTAGEWNWLDPDYMASGVSVYAERAGFGHLDADPVEGVAIFTAHLTSQSTSLMPVLGKDLAPGTGIFDYAPGEPNCDAYLWPPISIDGQQTVHCALLDDATREQLYYTRVQSWPEWQPPVSIVGSQPNPTFPDQNIAASKVSQKVCVAWVYSEGAPYEPAYYRISEDGGETWGEATELTPPPAYSGDTVPSFHITSLFPWYDEQDRLHIVAGVIPSVHETLYIIPAEIWHWCPDNDPQWSKVHRAGCDPINLQASVGYNAAYACRPSIGQDQDGNLYVAWEQFDSSNVEPVTSLLRADIFAAASTDGGNTWLPAVKLTEAGTASCRFPCVTDQMVDLAGARYMPVIYEIDQQAGFIVQGQGSSTNNPFVVQWVPVESLGVVPGVAEGAKTPARLELAANPNPFSGRTVVSYALPQSGVVNLTLFDAAGRPVQTLFTGYRPAGRYTFNLNDSKLAAGVYFSTLTTRNSSLTKKLTVVR